jgi:hypothetical protein
MKRQFDGIRPDSDIEGGKGRRAEKGSIAPL